MLEIAAQRDVSVAEHGRGVNSKYHDVCCDARVFCKYKKAD